MTLLQRIRPSAAPHDVGAGQALVDRLAVMRTRASAPRTRRLDAPWWLLGLLATAVTGWVMARGLWTAPMRTDDEGTYMAQAYAVLRHWDLAPYTYWYDHPPLGWMIIAAWMAGPGALLDAPTLIAEGRQFMTVLAMVSSFLTVMLVRRLGLSLAAGAVAALVVALSPLAVAFHRMVLLDNIVVPLVLGGLVLALSPRRRLIAVAASGVLIGAAVLVKITAAIVLPFAAWLLWRSFAGPTRRMAVTIWAMAVSGLMLLFPAFAMIKGELLPGPGRVSLWQGLRFQLVSRPSNGSVLDGRSAAHAIVEEWAWFDSWILVGGVAAAMVALASRRLRPLAGIVLVMALLVLRPGYLPMPFVILAVPFLAVAIAGVIEAVSRRLIRTVIAAGMHEPDIGTNGNGRVRRAVVAIGAVVMASGMLASASAVASDWHVRLGHLMTSDMDAPYRSSTQWVLDNVQPGEVILVDHVTRTDLLGHGYPEDTLLWFSRVDNDPAVTARVGSWEGIDWIVSTHAMRTAPTNGPIVAEALERSTPESAWGPERNRIIVSRVDGG